MKLNKIDFKEFEPIMERRGSISKGDKNLLYYLYKRKKDGSYWESQPLYEEEHMYYSGGPMQYIKVSIEYIKEHYPDLKLEKE